MPLPLVILLLPVLLLALPVVLPVVAFLEARDRRRRQRAAERFTCVRCGTVLGRASLDRADDDWRAEWAERLKRHPHVKWRVVRRVWAVCVSCSARYEYEHGAFHLEQAGLSPGAGSAAPAPGPGPALRAGRVSAPATRPTAR